MCGFSASDGTACIVNYALEMQRLRFRKSLQVARTNSPCNMSITSEKVLPREYTLIALLFLRKVALLMSIYANAETNEAVKIYVFE